jgi:hypothetical protein
MCCSHLLEIWEICNMPNNKAAMHEAIAHKHLGRAKHGNA